jgi:phosphocarrier protein HPr
MEGPTVMKVKKIKLLTINDAKAFVTEAMKCKFDIDVGYNHLVIDAKSILGVLSLDLRKVLDVRAHGVDEGFERYLESVAAEEELIA